MKRFALKRITALVLALIMTLSLLPMTVWAEVLESAPVYEFSGSYVAEDDGVSNEEAFAAYFQRELDASLGYEAPSFYSTSALKDGTLEKEIYDLVKAELVKIAEGTATSADIRVYPTKGWSTEDLGVTELISGNSLSAEADAAITAKLNLVYECLLADCPMELYWHDKTQGASFGMPDIDIGEENSLQTMKPKKVSYTFIVATDYRDNTDENCVTTDASITGATSAVINNAKVIVSANAAKSDFEKLEAYKDAICALVSYNDEAAASTSTTDGINPWQMIWVFDEDSATEVVCEGYAKAFQYLCDLSTFSGDVECHTVSGTMSGGTGAGRHMWNVVTMEDGKNYLVDVTNCDEGAIGENGELFMASTTNSANSNQTHTFTIGGEDIVFTYDGAMSDLFCDGYLAISETAYAESDQGNNNQGDSGIARACGVTFFTTFDSTTQTCDESVVTWGDENGAYAYAVCGAADKTIYLAAPSDQIVTVKKNGTLISTPSAGTFTMDNNGHTAYALTAQMPSSGYTEYTVTRSDADGGNAESFTLTCDFYPTFSSGFEGTAFAMNCGVAMFTKLDNGSLGYNENVRNDYGSATVMSLGKTEQTVYLAAGVNGTVTVDGNALTQIGTWFNPLDNRYSKVYEYTEKKGTDSTVERTIRRNDDNPESFELTFDFTPVFNSSEGFNAFARGVHLFTNKSGSDLSVDDSVVTYGNENEAFMYVACGDVASRTVYLAANQWDTLSVEDASGNAVTLSEVGMWPTQYTNGDGSSFNVTCKVYEMTVPGNDSTVDYTVTRSWVDENNQPGSEGFTLTFDFYPTITGPLFNAERGVAIFNKLSGGIFDYDHGTPINGYGDSAEVICFSKTSQTVYLSVGVHDKLSVSDSTGNPVSLTRIGTWKSTNTMMRGPWAYEVYEMTAPVSTTYNVVRTGYDGGNREEFALSFKSESLDDYCLGMWGARFFGGYDSTKKMPTYEGNLFTEKNNIVTVTVPGYSSRTVYLGFDANDTSLTVTKDGDSTNTNLLTDTGGVWTDNEGYQYKIYALTVVKDSGDTVNCTFTRGTTTFSIVFDFSRSLGNFGRSNGNRADAYVFTSMSGDNLYYDDSFMEWDAADGSFIYGACGNVSTREVYLAFNMWHDYEVTDSNSNPVALTSVSGTWKTPYGPYKIFKMTATNPGSSSVTDEYKITRSWSWFGDHDEDPSTPDQLVTESESANLIFDFGPTFTGNVWHSFYNVSFFSSLENGQLLGDGGAFNGYGDRVVIPVEDENQTTITRYVTVPLDNNLIVNDGSQDLNLQQEGLLIANGALHKVYELTVNKPTDGDVVEFNVTREWTWWDNNNPVQEQVSFPLIFSFDPNYEVEGDGPVNARGVFLFTTKNGDDLGYDDSFIAQWGDTSGEKIYLPCGDSASRTVYLAVNQYDTLNVSGAATLSNVGTWANGDQTCNVYELTVAKPAGKTIEYTVTRSWVDENQQANSEYFTLTFDFAPTFSGDLRNAECGVAIFSYLDGTVLGGDNSVFGYGGSAEIACKDNDKKTVFLAVGLSNELTVNGSQQDLEYEGLWPFDGWYFRVYSLTVDKPDTGDTVEFNVQRSWTYWENNQPSLQSESFPLTFNFALAPGGNNDWHPLEVKGITVFSAYGDGNLGYQVPMDWDAMGYNDSSNLVFVSSRPNQNKTIYLVSDEALYVNGTELPVFSELPEMDDGRTVYCLSTNGMNIGYSDLITVNIGSTGNSVNFQFVFDGIVFFGMAFYTYIEDDLWNNAPYFSYEERKTCDDIWVRHGFNDQGEDVFYLNVPFVAGEGKTLYMIAPDDVASLRVAGGGLAETNLYTLETVVETIDIVDKYFKLTLSEDVTNNNNAFIKAYDAQGQELGGFEVQFTCSNNNSWQPMGDDNITIYSACFDNGLGYNVPFEYDGMGYDSTQTTVMVPTRPNQDKTLYLVSAEKLYFNGSELPVLPNSSTTDGKTIYLLSVRGKDSGHTMVEVAVGDAGDTMKFDFLFDGVFFTGTSFYTTFDETTEKFSYADRITCDGLSVEYLPVPGAEHFYLNVPYTVGKENELYICPNDGDIADVKVINGALNGTTLYTFEAIEDPDASTGYTKYYKVTLSEDLVEQGNLMLGLYDGNGEKINREIDVIFNPQEVPPVVTASDDLSLTYGEYSNESVNVTVDELSGYTYTYQWYDADNEEIVGATSDSYTIPDDLMAYKYSYYCIVTATRNDTSKELTTESTAITVTVCKATPKCEAPVAQNSVTYGAKLSEVALTADWTWTNREIVPKVNNSGYTAYFVPNDNINYDWTKIDGWNEDVGRVERTVEVTVNKQLVDEPAEDATKFVYTGVEQTYAVAASDLYTVSNNTRTDAGSQTVTVVLNDKDNYAWIGGNSDDLEYTFTIAKAPLTITANAKSITYGAAPANAGVSYTGFVNGESEDKLTGTLSYSFDYKQYDNVGEYAITSAGLSSNNYAITFVDGTLTVEQKEIGIKWSNTELTYSGKAQAPTATATGMVNGDKVMLTVSGEQTNASDVAYTATVTAVSNDNYKLPEGVSTQFTIAKAQPSYTIPVGLTATYGQTLADVNLPAGWAWADATLSVGAVGSNKFAVEFTPKDTVNYNKVSGTATITVNKQQIAKPDADDTKFVYTGVAQTYTVAASELYTVSGNTCIEAGSQTVTIALTDKENYAWVGGSSDDLQYTFTIAKAPLTITANAKSITYGAAPANAGVSYTGFVNGETEDKLTGTLSYSYDYKQYGNVGTYAITPAGLSSNNYAITFVDGTLTVEQKEIGIKWSNTELTYSGKAQAPTATATGMVNGDKVTLAVSGEQTNIGSYTATVTGLVGDKAGNYKLPANVTTAFTVDYATVTFNTNGAGMIEAIENLTYGDKITEPSKPEKAKHTFAGWFSDEKCTKLWVFDKDTITGDMTLYAKWSENPVYDVSGIVYEQPGKDEHSQKVVANAHVQLVLGTTVVVEQTTNEKGEFFFGGQEEGDYNLVVTHRHNNSKHDKVVTVLVSLHEHNADDIKVVLPKHVTNSKVEHKNNNPEVEGEPDTGIATGTLVGGLDVVAETMRKKEEQKVDTSSGNVEASEVVAKVEVTLTVEDTPPVTNPTTEEEKKVQKEQVAIQQKAPGKEVVFFDLSVLMSVTDNNDQTTESRISDTGSLLEIRIPFEKGNKSGITIYRYHGDQAEALPEVMEGGQTEGFWVGDDGYIHIYTHKFSTYAVGYTEPGNNTGGTSGGYYPIVTPTTPVEKPEDTKPEDTKPVVTPTTPVEDDVTPAPEDTTPVVPDAPATDDAPAVDNTPADDAAQSDSGNSVGLWVGVALAVLVVAIIVVVILIKRKKA